MKYEFVEKGLDDYELHYTNKEGKNIVIPFKRTVELASKLTGADAEARMEFLTYLTSIGKTKKDFVIEKNEDGKIIVDESNYRDFEQSFIDKKLVELLFEVYKKLFNMDFTELLLDMGINEQNAEKYIEQWGTFNGELHDIIVNGKVKTPSIQEINEQ